MNSLEQYISDLNHSCWYRSDVTNGYGIANPSNVINIYNGITIGVRINSGTGVPDFPYTSFRFYEMLIFDKQLSPNQVAQVQTYLKLKYNI